MTGHSLLSVPSDSEVRRLWRTGNGGGPFHHMLMRNKYVSQLGWSMVELPPADITHVHGVADRPADVLTIHAVWPTGYFPEYPPWWNQQNATMARSITKAHTVLALSQFTANLILDTLGSPDRLLLLPQAIDPDEWRGVTRAGLGVTRPLVLWGKNTVDILRDPRPALVLAGMRPHSTVVLTCDTDDLRGFTIPDNVLLLGRQPYEAMQALVADCDVYLATTLESSGQGHLEAMFLGKPVLGYRWGGVAETVPASGSQRAGALVAPGHSDELADGLDDIMSDYEQFGLAAQHAVTRGHLWPDVARGLVLEYETIMRQRG